ncbi:60S ribosomal protein L31 [Tupaia chinensis]|uniref:Large ribosomal subunit protein eL31 n=1 Tax=Tupaia chinensis TaxID=246437 RepID=L9KI02_TUPCH|nr:60S ribosomal protein L31 [Tupaia chinensis]
MAPAKGGEERPSCHQRGGDREYTVSTHKRIPGLGFKKRVPRALREIRKFATKEMGTPGVRTDTRLNTAVWARGVKNVPHRLHVRVSRKGNEDEDSPNKLRSGDLCTCYLLQKSAVNVDENELLIFK